MIRYTRITACIIYIIIITAWTNEVHGQKVIPEKYITEADQEKFTQIEKIKEEARQLSGEAQEIYTRLKKMKKGEGAKRDRESVDKMREEALNKDIEAFEKKKEANRQLYRIYDRHLNGFQGDPENKNAAALKASLFHENARKLFYRASVLRNEAYNHVKSLESKFSKMEKAQNIEQLGLKKFSKALQILYRAKQAGLLNPSGSTGNEKVVIDRDLLEAIRATLSRQDQKHTLYDRIHQMRVEDTVSYSLLDTLLHTYRNRRWSSRDKQFQNDSRDVTDNETNNTANEDVSEETGREAPRQHEDTENPANDTRQSEKGGGREKGQDTNNDQKSVLESLNYRVQIASDRQSLSQGALRKLYDGNKKIYHVNEGGWNKYMIGEFSSYSEANTFRKNLDVQEAFIVAWREGRTISPGALGSLTGKNQTPAPSTPSSTRPSQPGSKKDTAAEASSNLQRKTSTTQPEPTNTLTYRVQIAADRVELGDQELESIYKGIKHIYRNRGNGWYRYSIGSCPSYYHARRLNRHVHVRGSWVVAYKKGERLNAYKMSQPIYTHPNPTINQKKPAGQGLVFKVQVAASTLRLNEHDLKYIYGGKRKVTEIQQGKYYKYSIGQFDSFREAVELQKTVCVPGAFVVAFENGRPLDVREAKKKNNR
jgi:hypothetical protein